MRGKTIFLRSELSVTRNKSGDANGAPPLTRDFPMFPHSPPTCRATYRAAARVASGKPATRSEIRRAERAKVKARNALGAAIWSVTARLAIVALPIAFFVACVALDLPL